MFRIVKTIVVLVYILIQVSLVFAQTETENKEEVIPIFKTESPLSEEKITKNFLDFINKEAYAAEISREEERKILREKWKQFLGVDIFYPYFKKKEIEEKIEEKKLDSVSCNAKATANPPTPKVAKIGVMVTPKEFRIIRTPIIKTRRRIMFCVSEVIGNTASNFEEYNLTDLVNIFAKTKVTEKIPSVSKIFPPILTKFSGSFEIISAKYIPNIKDQITKGVLIAEMITSSILDSVFSAQEERRLNKIFLKI